jgi:hypothetical protein
MSSRFFHELPEAGELFETLAAEMGLPPAVVEKDYWVMHCLWGLRECGLSFEMKGGTSLSKGWRCIDRFSEDIDLRFEAPSDLSVRGDKPPHVESRLAYFDGLASAIQIPGVAVERNRVFDDDKARNGGISLRYDSLFATLPELRPDVLLEAGFTQTAPHEPRDFTSWAWERASAARLEVRDNRAPAIPCFNPEYTFVDKLQTICRRYRQYAHRQDPEKDRARQFLRHYYDLYRLLQMPRVRDFIGTREYTVYSEMKIKGLDRGVFIAKAPFEIPDDEVLRDFEEEFAALAGLFFAPAPAFADIIREIRRHARSL